jgi:Ca-activated chloride channel family protein
MNTNEHESDPRASLRQKLVAVLLGEAGAEESAEVERALAADPQLAAERARLAATIGLVQSLQGADAGEHLSPAAAERLADAAAQRATGPRPLAGPQPFVRPEGARRAWHASPVFRLAAMFALLLGSFAMWRSAEGTADKSKRGANLPASALQASLEKDALERSQLDAKNDGAAEGREANEIEARVDLGLAAAASEPPPAESAPAAPMLAVTEPSGASQPAETAAAQVAAGEELLGERLRLLDALEGQDEAKKAEIAALIQAEEKLRFELDREANVVFEEAVVPQGVLTKEQEEALRALPSGSRGGTPVGVGSIGHRAPAVSVFTSRRAGAGGKGGQGLPASPPRGAEVQPELPATNAAPETIDRPSIPASDDGANQALLALSGAKDERGDEKALEALRELGYSAGGGGQSTDRFGEDSDEEQARYRFEQARRQLTPAERAALIDQLIQSCRRRPQERPRDMFYRWWGDNAFEWARNDPLSTFAVDVDTASYTLARRYLAERMLPEKAQIRTEEFVNYFKGDIAPPSEATFRVATELAPSLFARSPDTWMLRVALRGREVSRTQRKPVALTFVVDVSGSMREQRRLELVKHALRLLVSELDARDTISIVAFTNDARLVLPATSARDRGLIESAIHPLQPEGGTNVQAGLRMGYEAAVAKLVEGATNRVVLLSDGVGNIGETDAAALSAEVERQRDAGIYLNTVGVGMNNVNDAFLEQLADKGDGMCNYVDDEREARRALVDNFTSAFEPIASDVKIQVEFDPAQVERYRLLGYENRAVADHQFRNDAVDAGEVGAGHQVVALYEVVRTGRTLPDSKQAAEQPLATVRVRWKPPTAAGARFEAHMAQEIAQPVHAREAAGSFAATSSGYRRSVLVGQLAEFLRRSIHARDDSFELLLGEARKLAPELADADFDEFVRMVERTVELITVEWGRYDTLARRLDDLRMQNYLRAQVEGLGGESARLDELDRQIGELEAEVRRMCEKGTAVR